MIIELYGPPGTGKSTLARALLSEGTFIRVRHERLLSMIFFCLLFVLRYPVRSYRLFSMVVRYGAGWKLTYFKFINVFVQYNAKWMHASLLRGPALIDQGHHQAIISLFEEEVTHEVIARLCALFPKPDILVIFDIPEEVRRARVATRAYGSVRDQVGEEARIGWERAMNANHRTFVAEQKVGPHLCTVRNDAEISILTDELRALASLT